MEFLKQRENKKRIDPYDQHQQPDTLGEPNDEITMTGRRSLTTVGQV